MACFAPWSLTGRERPSEGGRVVLGITVHAARVVFCMFLIPIELFEPLGCLCLWVVHAPLNFFLLVCLMIMCELLPVFRPMFPLLMVSRFPRDHVIIGAGFFCSGGCSSPLDVSCSLWLMFLCSLFSLFSHGYERIAAVFFRPVISLCSLFSMLSPCVWGNCCRILDMRLPVHSYYCCMRVVAGGGVFLSGFLSMHFEPALLPSLPCSLTLAYSLL